MSKNQRKESMGHLVVPIIRIFMIDLNWKSTIKKIELIEKSAKKEDRCTHWSMIDLLFTLSSYFYHPRLSSRIPT